MTCQDLLSLALITQARHEGMVHLLLNAGVKAAETVKDRIRESIWIMPTYHKRSRWCSAESDDFAQ